MPRLFTDIPSPEYLKKSSPLITSLPFSVSIWIKPDNVDSGGTKVLWHQGNTGDTYFWYVAIFTQGSLRKKPVLFANENGTNDWAVSSTQLVVGEWAHICAVETATNDRKILVNGAGKGTNTTDLDPLAASHDVVGLGARVGAVATLGYEGTIGHVAVWDAALTDEEAIILATGVSPLKIRRSNLISYIPLNGQSSEPDVVEGTSYTNNGSSVVSEEPPIPNSIVAPE